MEGCLAVEREQEKVIKKLRTVSGSASEKLQRVLDQIQALKDQLAAGAQSVADASGRLCLVVRDPWSSRPASSVAPCSSRRQRDVAGAV